MKSKRSVGGGGHSNRWWMTKFLNSIRCALLCQRDNSILWTGGERKQLNNLELFFFMGISESTTLRVASAGHQEIIRAQMILRMRGGLSQHKQFSPNWEPNSFQLEIHLVDMTQTTNFEFHEWIIFLIIRIIYFEYGLADCVLLRPDDVWQSSVSTFFFVLFVCDTRSRKRLVRFSPFGT